MDLRDQISPQQRLSASITQSARQLSTVRIPLFGPPPDWIGHRYLGSTRFEHGIERTPDGSAIATVHETVELVHEQAGPGVELRTAYLSVESTDVFGDITARAMTGRLTDFIVDRHRRAATDAGSTARSAAVADTFLFEMTVVVDGRPTAFAAVRSGDRLVARWPGHRVTITVMADGWPAIRDLALSRVTDLRPYLDGRRQRLEERSGYRLN